jgi:uncharacterized GH25 family protein
MRRAAAVIGFALLAAPALAHDTWLLPTHFTVAPGATITAELTSAMRFPRGETAVKAERLARRGIRLGAQPADLRPAGASATALRLTGRASSPGVAALWLETRPRTLDLKDALVEEYLREIGVWETTGAAWRAAGRKPWRETYVKCAKSYVRVGVGSTDAASWWEPVGLALELVPGSDPTRLAVGATLTVRLLRQGQPLAHHPVTAQPAGREGVPAQTDDAGQVTFTIDRAGAWLVKSTALRPTVSGEWESEFTTLTLAAGATR